MYLGFCFPHSAQSHLVRNAGRESVLPRHNSASSHPVRAYGRQYQASNKQALSNPMKMNTTLQNC